MPRSLRRALAIAVTAAATAVACGDANQRAGGMVCAACGLIASTEAEILEQDRAARASCGECPDGMECNTVYQPPRCARSPGLEGDYCGFAIATEFTCELGYTCRDAVCRTLPGVGAPCDFVSGEDVTLAHLQPTYCAPGLVCGTDEHCHPGCADGCTSPSRCNPLFDPPRCTVDLAMSGDPCGPVHSMWSIDCLPFLVCVDRGSGPHCETSGQGPPCTTDLCPVGFTCNAQHICIAGGV